jgi:hypothetical protein
MKVIYWFAAYLFVGLWLAVSPYVLKFKSYARSLLELGCPWNIGRIAFRGWHILLARGA